jgi:hypothetical protein
MKNFVYKLIPKDFEQGSVEQNQSWYNEIKIFLNQLPIGPNSERFNRDGLFGVKAGLKNDNEYYYKFYSLDEQLFLDTNFEGELNFPETKLIKIEAPHELLITHGESYCETVLESDFVKINGLYYRLINLYEFSKNMSPGQLMDYGDYCVFLKRIDPVIAKRKVNTQRKLHHSNIYSPMRNIESESSYNEADKISEAMIEGVESLFEVEAWIIVRAESEFELHQQTKVVIKSLKQAEVEPLIETVGSKSLFFSILFGVKPTFKRSHEPPTSYVANLLPLKRDQLHESGMALNSLRGNLVYFNLFEESLLNFNLLISGQSGSGKSMIAQKILQNEIYNGTSAIVLDLGNSFQKIVKFSGGETLSRSFNPMQFKSPHYLKELITSVIPDGELTSKLEGKIFNLILENVDKTNSFKELIQIISKVVPDLDLYFSEIWEFFDDEVRTLSKLTYVDTSLYPDKIKAPLIIYLIECFKHLDGKRVFIFDEVWSFLTKNADYIAECFRTFRKHGASAIAISQGIEDFIQTPLGFAIAQNSYTKFYFSQSSNCKTFLDDIDQQKIKNLVTKKGNYSEFFVKTETLRKIVHYYPTFLEYELFTSNYDDNLSFEAFRKKNEGVFNFYEVVNRYVQFKYFYGGLNE